MKWIDIPACRILEVTKEEVLSSFETTNESGEICKGLETVYRIIRKSDSKVFKLARFIPENAGYVMCCYLEEL